VEDGSHGAAIVDELSPQQGDTVVTHQRIGGFHNSELDATLRHAGIDTVVFVGVATNASVEGTARVASDLGYRTVVVSDACSAATPAAHAASLESLVCSPRSSRPTSCSPASACNRPRPRSSRAHLCRPAETCCRSSLRLTNMLAFQYRDRTGRGR